MAVGEREGRDARATPPPVILCTDDARLTAAEPVVPHAAEERMLLTFRDGRVTFRDLPHLRQLAGHHSGYLDQANGPA